MNYNSFRRRLFAMVKKEFYQLIRDKSSILIGIFLPIILIFIIGYGISLDVKQVPIAVVRIDNSPLVNDVFSFLNGSEYFLPTYVTSTHDAEILMNKKEVDAILVIPSDFSKNLYNHKGNCQLIVNGVDAINGTVIKSYVETSVKKWEVRSEERRVGKECRL